MERPFLSMDLVARRWAIVVVLKMGVERRSRAMMRGRLPGIELMERGTVMGLVLD